MAKSKKTEIKETIIEKSIEPKIIIKNIELLNFTLSPAPNEMPKEFHFEARISQQIQQKDKSIIAIISINIKDKNGSQLGTLSSSSAYEVENLLDHIKDKNSLNDIGLKINKITVSMVRGLMFGVFRGTFLHNALLPIVDEHFIKSN